MLRKKGLLFCFLGASLSLLGAAAQARPAAEILRPLKTMTPPVIDGNLDEPVWAEAPPVTGFRTFIPDFGRDFSGKAGRGLAYPDLMVKLTRARRGIYRTYE